MYTTPRAFRTKIPDKEAAFGDEGHHAVASLDPDVAAVLIQKLTKSARNSRFAAARGAVDQHRATTNHGRPDLLNYPFRQNQVCKNLA